MDDWPTSVVQVYPQDNFTVYVYFSNGQVKLYNAKPLIEKGGVFKKIADIDVFMRTCTVLNRTLAWDLSGRFDPTTCIDVDPEVIYQKGRDSQDPLAHIEANNLQDDDNN